MKNLHFVISISVALVLGFGSCADEENKFPRPCGDAVATSGLNGKATNLKDAKSEDNENASEKSTSDEKVTTPAQSRLLLTVSPKMLNNIEKSLNLMVKLLPIFDQSGRDLLITIENNANTDLILSGSYLDSGEFPQDLPAVIPVGYTGVITAVKNWGFYGVEGVICYKSGADDFAIYFANPFLGSNYQAVNYYLNTSKTAKYYFDHIGSKTTSGIMDTKKVGAVRVSGIITDGYRAIQTVKILGYDIQIVDVKIVNHSTKDLTFKEQFTYQGAYKYGLADIPAGQTIVAHFEETVPSEGVEAGASFQIGAEPYSTLAVYFADPEVAPNAHKAKYFHSAWPIRAMTDILQRLSIPRLQVDDSWTEKYKITSEMTTGNIAQQTVHFWNFDVLSVFKCNGFALSASDDNVNLTSPIVANRNGAEGWAVQSADGFDTRKVFLFKANSQKALVLDDSLALKLVQNPTALQSTNMVLNGLNTYSFYWDKLITVGSDLVLKSFVLKIDSAGNLKTEVFDKGLLELTLIPATLELQKPFKFVKS